MTKGQAMTDQSGGLEAVADVLNRAADLLSKPGAWAQRIYYQSDNCYCMVGAMRAAAGVKSAVDVERGAIANAVHAALGADDCDMLYEWNDADGRTQAEVVAKLREAAAIALATGAAS